MPAELVERLRQVEILAKRSDFSRALALLDELLQFAPDRPELLYRRALILIALERFPEAVSALQHVLRLVPGNAVIHNALGSALASSGATAQAAEMFRRACQQAPQRGDYWYNLGRALDGIDDVAGACSAYDRAIDLMPADAGARVSRADARRAVGRLDEAAADLRQAIRLKPDSLSAWTGLVSLKSVRLDDTELDQLGSLYAAAGIDTEPQAAFGFIYGQALEAAGEYRQAFSVLSRSNAVKAARVRWHPADVTAFVDAAADTFSADLPRASDNGLGREVIFLLGMPRCGSTLVEQILAAHPDVEGAGELVDVHAVLEEETARRGVDMLAWAPEATAEDWTRLGHAYLARTARWRSRHPLFTDKQLDNWRYVGALQAMLPSARFIHCRRDSVETCWSCFKHNFYRHQAGFTYDLEHLARYWLDSMRLTRFWHARHPRLIFDHIYEDFIAQPEHGVRRLLDYCGLSFDDACLRFHESGRRVRTASAGQVRQPLDRGTAVSARYGELLDPLRESLRTKRQQLESSSGALARY